MDQFTQADVAKQKKIVEIEEKKKNREQKKEQAETLRNMKKEKKDEKDRAKQENLSQVAPKRRRVTKAMEIVIEWKCNHLKTIKIYSLKCKIVMIKNKNKFFAC